MIGWGFGIFNVFFLTYVSVNMFVAGEQAKSPLVYGVVLVAIWVCKLLTIECWTHASRPCIYMTEPAKHVLELP
eukprot:SAG11_NODE_2081_length_3851_cov_2.513859_3_plen_74_part_00